MKEVYRMTISSEDILGTLEALSCLSPAQMSTGARELQKKFQLQAAKINIGAATPAYVTTGAKKPTISVESLGATDEYQGTNAGNVTPDMLGNTGANNLSASKPSAELDDSEAALLAELDRQMREELASNGAGSQNVILQDRRKTPRDNQVEAINVNQI